LTSADRLGTQHNGAVVTLTLARSTDLTPSDIAAILDLLGKAFGDRFTPEDADHTFGGTHALVRDGDILLAHASVVPRRLIIGEHVLDAGYVEGVATLPSRERQGLGSSAMAALGDLIRAQFDIGALSTSATGFYRRLGWEKWQGPSFVVREGTRIRTEDEDDGLMVLRCDATADIELSWPIACDDRPGDAW
jgi:aminoglycoside 2'-N-acetyltransferase I